MLNTSTNDDQNICFFCFKVADSRINPTSSPPNWSAKHERTPMSPRESSHAICLGNAADGTDGGRARCGWCQEL
jgi:hypothetical protein